MEIQGKHAAGRCEPQYSPQVSANQRANVTFYARCQIFVFECDHLTWNMIMKGASVFHRKQKANQLESRAYAYFFGLPVFKVGCFGRIGLKSATSTRVVHLLCVLS